MNKRELSNNLTEKLAFLSEEQLNLVSHFVDELKSQKTEISAHEYKEKAFQKWRYLIENNQELDEEQPLTDQEIQVICQIFSQENKKRPAGLCEGEFTIDDDFNDPLPEEILALFYR
jgi:hypothetical protein